MPFLFSQMEKKRNFLVRSGSSLLKNYAPAMLALLKKRQEDEFVATVSYTRVQGEPGYKVLSHKLELTHIFYFAILN